MPLPVPYRCLAALALALAVPLAVPAQGEPAAGYHIAAPSAAALRAAAAGEVLLVDIRQPEEWQATGVLPEALLLTFESPESFLAELAPHLDGRPLALICRTGNRTAPAAALIAPRLDAPVIDIAGGLFRLLAEGYTPAAATRAQGCRVC